MTKDLKFLRSFAPFLFALFAIFVSMLASMGEAQAMAPAPVLSGKSVVIQTIGANNPANTLQGGASLMNCPFCSSGTRVWLLGDNQSESSKYSSLNFNNVIVQEGGTYDLLIYFVNGDAAGTSRHGNVFVNGAFAGSVSFPANGNWNAITGATKIQINLKSGMNWIQLNGPTWLADIDRVEISTLASTSAPVPPESQLPANCAQSAVDNPRIDAGAEIQDCISHLNPSTGGTLYLLPGIYYLQTPINLTPGNLQMSHLSIQTIGVSSSSPACLTAGAPSCAVLQAQAQFGKSLPEGATGGLLYSQNSNPYLTLDHIALDGNRSVRIDPNSPLYSACYNSSPVRGFNANINTSHAIFNGLASVNTLCGTSLGLGNSPFVSLTNSYIAHNGQSGTHGFFSDGVTIGVSDGLVVKNTLFDDNSDVSLIFGPRVDSSNGSGEIANNQFTQSGSNHVNAMIMGQSWAGPSSASAANGLSFGSLNVSGNSINCGSRLQCTIGIMVGSGFWQSNPVRMGGGNFVGNSISNSEQGILVYGGGTPSDPNIISDNVIIHSGGVHFGNCTSDAFDVVTSDSVIDALGNNVSPSSNRMSACSIYTFK